MLGIRYRRGHNKYEWTKKAPFKRPNIQFE